MKLNPQLVTLEGCSAYGYDDLLAGESPLVRELIEQEVYSMGYDSLEEASELMGGRFFDWIKKKARGIRDFIRKRQEARGQAQAQSQFAQQMQQMQQQAMQQRQMAPQSGVSNIMKNPIVPIAGLALVMMMMNKK